MEIISSGLTVLTDQNLILVILAADFLLCMRLFHCSFFYLSDEQQCFCTKPHAINGCAVGGVLEYWPTS